MEQPKYGKLLTPDIKLHRQYFNEMVKLLGIQVIYRAPYPGKHYTTYAEIESCYEPPMLVGCIFDEHPHPRTMKKLGWNTELEAQAAIISIPYDLQGLQQGSLFLIPSAFDNTKARLFRVPKITSIMIVPCSLTCQIVPEYENTFSNNSYSHKSDSFNLLNREDDEN